MSPAYALDSGVAFVLFDWMYHYVTDESPMDLNSFLKNFTPEERKRIMFLDGITKSLGGSNIRNCHLIADDAVIKFITARASHGVIPSFFSLAVAMAAYEMGYAEASRSIVEPTNASRIVLRGLLVHLRLLDGCQRHPGRPAGDVVVRLHGPLHGVSELRLDIHVKDYTCLAIRFSASSR